MLSIADLVKSDENLIVEVELSDLEGDPIVKRGIADSLEHAMRLFVENFGTEYEEAGHMFWSNELNADQRFQFAYHTEYTTSAIRILNVRKQADFDTIKAKFKDMMDMHEDTFIMGSMDP